MMKSIATAIILLISVTGGSVTGSVTGTPQTASFKKQALDLAQQTPASGLDAELPNRPFASWFNQFVGPQAGVVWQLTECGDPISGSGDEGPDLPACAQANAILADGRKVVVAISVGTFKKGLNEYPAFFRAVVEVDDQLYQVRRLRDLPAILNNPQPVATKSMPVNLPEIRRRPLQLISQPLGDRASQPSPGFDNSSRANDLSKGEMPPPPAPARPQGPVKISENTLSDNAITKVKPTYPASAKRMDAYGRVEVRITISEEGRVMNATAISGNLALRSTAVKAALQWVFKPTIINGVPVKAEGVLTFVFAQETQ